MASQLALILQNYNWLLSSKFKHVILFCPFVLSNTDIKKNYLIFFLNKIEITFLGGKLHAVTENGLFYILE